MFLLKSGSFRTVPKFHPDRLHIVAVGLAKGWHQSGKETKQNKYKVSLLTHILIILYRHYVCMQI